MNNGDKDSIFKKAMEDFHKRNQEFSARSLAPRSANFDLLVNPSNFPYAPTSYPPQSSGQGGPFMQSQPPPPQQASGSAWGPGPSVTQGTPSWQPMQPQGAQMTSPQGPPSWKSNTQGHPTAPPQGTPTWQPMSAQGSQILPWQGFASFQPMHGQGIQPQEIPQGQPDASGRGQKRTREGILGMMNSVFSTAMQSIADAFTTTEDDAVLCTGVSQGPPQGAPPQAKKSKFTIRKLPQAQAQAGPKGKKPVQKTKQPDIDKDVWVHFITTVEQVDNNDFSGLVEFGKAMGLKMMSSRNDFTSTIKRDLKTAHGNNWGYPVFALIVSDNQHDPKATKLTADAQKEYDEFLNDMGFYPGFDGNTAEIKEVADMLGV